MCLVSKVTLHIWTCPCQGEPQADHGNVETCNVLNQNKPLDLHTISQSMTTLEPTKERHHSSYTNIYMRKPDTGIFWKMEYHPMTRQNTWQPGYYQVRSEEHTSELQSLRHLVCRLLLGKKKAKQPQRKTDHRPPTTQTAADRPRA